MIAAANAIYGTPEWLQELQAALIFGCVILAVYLIVDTVLIFRQMHKPAAKKFERCQLHSREVGKCPPGSHDEDRWT